MPSSSTSCDLVRVLLVDDNEGILRRVAALLTPDCVIVGSASDGQSAVRAAEALRPDVIVLDISMPGMSGLEVASAVRRAGSTAAIVFLTVHDDDAFVRAAAETGALGYVFKARLASDLPTAVQEASAGRRFISPRQ